MSDRPLLFLDVDGVLNCIHRRDDYDHYMLGAMAVWVPPGTAERVARLLEVYEPVWATAWLGSAHSSWRNVLGLDPMPWPYVNYLNYKLTDILRMAGGRRWAFVDDDIDFELKGLGWTRDMVDGLLLQPDEKVGLTDEHVEKLLEFASSGSRATATEGENDV